MHHPSLPSLNRPLANRLLIQRARLVWWWRTQSFEPLKRALDVLGVYVVLLVLAPLMLTCALVIKLTDPGPVLFWQRRVGRGGRVFAFPKFRSMIVNAEAVRDELKEANQHGDQGITFKMKRDPRVTPVGRFIRSTSIDELPQLWCVLRGDMSLVGPRPPLESEVARYTLQQRQRLSATPGLTCIWQISGRSEVPFPEQVKMDLRYIRGRSVWADIKLLIATPLAVIRGRGAY